MTVIDASAAVELVLQSSTGRDVARILEEPATRVSAPYLIDAEVAQALRQLDRRGAVPLSRAWEALVDFTTLDLLRYPHSLLLPRAWQLRRNATMYDALYIALAEVLDEPLVTADRRLTAVPGVTARINVVGGHA